uniref:Cytochrome c oxidase subunit 3 n=1 Tax=Onychiurus orientalis TaxID=280588 RepID=Q6DVH5_ONYOR|nr:cytochrome c oxidase subunit III [Onychiurus orientalis]AAT69324.1 cytochrome c oxidase subunit 3 [Onychiurus orientalis]
MMIKSNHYFHMVDQSPWPLSAAIGASMMTSGMISWFHSLNTSLMILGVLVLLFSTYQWWRDIARESTLQGLHTINVIKGMRWGMILFILSEVLFFFSFFWAFFHSSLSPINEIGLLWPPSGINVFNPLQVPLLNTIILLSSGVSVTWAHHSLMEKNYSQALQGTFLTVTLGVYFTLLQAFEYYESPFSMADSTYGSTFFIATGFHGLHVIIGSSFLTVCLIRHFFNHFSSYHHFGFEAAAWYWHFVDVVWLFLYISIYWWGA